jgi:hypothetical protein
LQLFLRNNFYIYHFIECIICPMSGKCIHSLKKNWYIKYWLSLKTSFTLIFI